MAVDWNDLRFVLTLSREGSLARTAKRLGVDHTTVGRRVEAAEAALGVKLFLRTPKGYVVSAEAEPVLGALRDVEQSVLALERVASAQHDVLRGCVRVTAPETFGACYVAPRLAAFGADHPGLVLELSASGAVADLGRREADVALRFFLSKHDDLVVRRAGEVAHGLYASASYLAAHPVASPHDLRACRVLTAAGGLAVVEAAWVASLTGGAPPAFVCDLTVGLLAAAREGAGVAVLPRYLGDAEPALRHIPMADEPRETLWITVHRDVARAPRVRAVVDFLAARVKRDRALLVGVSSAAAPETS